MNDMAIFLIGGLVTFLFIGSVLQANLYQALRPSDEEREPLPAPKATQGNVPGRTDAAVASTARGHRPAAGTVRKSHPLPRTAGPRNH